jgi:glycosyltransferase involved in cell wall biosynthesis
VRILHFVDRWTFGGLQTVVMELCEAQRRSGQSVEIAVREDGTNNPTSLERMAAAGVEVTWPFRGHHRHRLIQPWIVIPTLAKYIKGRAFDITHSHNPLSTHFVSPASILARVPSVNTMHATALIPRMNKREKAVYLAAAFVTSRVVSVHKESETTLRGYFPLLPTKKFDIAENGIGLGRYFAVPKRPQRDLITFGAVGRMTNVKNHHMLIEAFAAVRAKHPHIRLRLLGDGPLGERLRQHARDMGVANDVEFCGFQDDPSGFLGEIDVLCLSSNSETLPMCMLEGLAAGVPVVATRVGGVADLLAKTDGGWMCPPGDVKAFAAAMEQAIAEPDRALRGERARAHMQQYSVDRMAADYQRIYDSLLQ